MFRTQTHRRLAGGALAVVAAHVGWIGLRIGGDRATTAFTDGIGFGASTAATIASAFAATRSTGRTRVAWILMACGLGAYAAGDAMWTAHEVFLRHEVPFPSTADAAYMLLYPFGLAALVQFPSAAHRTSTRLRTMIDGLIIAVSVLFIGWSFVIGPTLASRSGDLLGQVISIGYPVGDVVLIWVVVHVLSRCAKRDRMTFGLIGGGLLLIALADAIFTYLEINDAYISGSFIDPLWTGGMLVICLGALRRARFNERVRDERWIEPRWVFAVYVPLGLAILTAIWVQLTNGHLPPFAFWSGITLVILVTVRQVIAVFDNHSLHTDLDRRVKDRTRELEIAMSEREGAFRELLTVRTEAERKLREALDTERQAADELRSADAMRSAFLMAISHELRTPLTSIVGYSTMLNDDMAEYSHDEIAQSIASIARQSQRLERLLMDLLDVERLTRGTIQPRMAETDISRLIQTVVDHSVSERDVHVDVDEELCATVDPALTERILENLVVNAQKHTPIGTKIFVAGRRRGCDLHLIVEDDGTGVPDDIKQRIFEPFEQGDVKGGTRPGTGVGLALVAKFTSLQGGRAWVEDRRGGGASFRVVLPGAIRGERGSAAGGTGRATVAA